MEATWQPIETAPKDGAPILLFKPEIRYAGFGDEAEMVTASWAAGYWHLVQTGAHAQDMEADGPFTHWMLLPPPPK